MTPSELRKAFKKDAVDYAISYMQLIMRPSQESKELADKKLNELLNKSLDAVIVSLPDVDPLSYAANSAQTNALVGKGMYRKEVVKLLQQAKSISKESE